MVTIAEADEAADLPSYEDLGQATDLSAVEAGIAAAEASAVPTSVAEEDWGEEDGEEEEEAEEEETEIDGMVEPTLHGAAADMTERRPIRRNEEEVRRERADENPSVFWPGYFESSDEGDESYVPERGDRDEDDEDLDTGMRQFMEGSRWSELRNEAWPSLMKVLQDPPVDDPHEPGLQAAALRFQNFSNQLAQRPWQLRKHDTLGRNMLHLALMRHRPDIVRAILTLEDTRNVLDVVTKPFEASGDSDKDLIPCIHLALSGSRSEQAENSLQCLQLLLDQRVNLIPQVDNSGRSGLHVACALGSSRGVELLLENNADPGLQDDYGFMALHYAIDSRNLDCVKQMIQVSDRSAFAGELNPFCRCIDRCVWDAALLLGKQGWPLAEGEMGINFLFDFASCRGVSREWHWVAEAMLQEGGDGMEEVTWPEIFKETNTLVVTHAHCGRHGLIPEETDDPQLRHQLIGNIPESPHRLEVLCGENGLLRTELFRDLRWAHEPHMAPIVDVLRVHEFWYVHKLMETVAEVRAHGQNRPVPIDSGDTKVTPDSWSAALYAAGAVLEAVDQVCGESARNAFCAVRPPGHHLGPAGAVDKKDLQDDPEGSQGFCLLNNVAIGAAYAKCVYRHFIRKVAIIDIDVHHGNGTEAIVRNLKYTPEIPKEKKGSMTFGGAAVSLTLFKPPACKPWLDGNDVDNVFFASIHGFGGGFYPGTGASCSRTAPRIINAPLKKGSGPAEFRRSMRHHILPQLQEFHPDLIFVSSGFDGHEDDLIGCCELSEEDYIWATQQLMAVANRCCNGRLVSVLEGGYNTRAEALSPFASAVASHVRTLMYTSLNYTYLDCEVVAQEGQNLEETETFVQRLEDLYTSEYHQHLRREEARRLRLRKRQLNLEMPPVKVQRADPAQRLEDEAVKEASETQADLEAELKEEKEELKEEKVDTAKVDTLDTLMQDIEKIESTLHERPQETEEPEEAENAENSTPFELEAETMPEAEELAEDSTADLVEEVLAGQVTKAEGEEVDPKVLEDCELMVEANDHFLHNVDLQKVEEQAAEVAWEPGE